jgi:phosphoglycolate phosphatase
VEAILFDWDGTLVDSLDALYQANVAVLAAFGLPFDADLYRRHFTPDWRLMYRRLGVPEARLGEANERWLRCYEGGASTTLFPGVTGALDRLRRSGVRIGLVTAGDRSVVGPQLVRLGVEDRFDVTVFGDDLAAHKPDPAPLLHALERLGLRGSARTAAYVGDVADDMRMAAAVGARGVGIPSALSDARALLAAGASEIAPSVVDWVDRVVGIMLVDGRPHAPAV